MGVDTKDPVTEISFLDEAVVAIKKIEDTEKRALLLAEVESVRASVKQAIQDISVENHKVQLDCSSWSDELLEIIGIPLIDDMKAVSEKNPEARTYGYAEGSLSAEELLTKLENDSAFRREHLENWVSAQVRLEYATRKSKKVEPKSMKNWFKGMLPKLFQ